MKTRFSAPILGLAAIFAALPLEAQNRTPSLWERTGTLPIVESSGVAVSRRHPGVLWTHNDSGDTPRIFAVRADGHLLATYDIVGARAVDWEDISLGPCAWDTSRTCILIGDIGDNAEQRTRVVLYAVEEPDPTAPGDSARQLGPARAVRVRYADRPHDAEVLALDGAGNAYIVTKGRTGPIVRYTIPRTDLLKDSIVAIPADTLPIVPQRMLGRWVTAGSIRPDGKEAVIRTYTEIYFFAVDGNRWTQNGPACFLGPREPQGEAIDYLDDGSLILLSEKSNGEATIFRARC